MRSLHGELQETTGNRTTPVASIAVGASESMEAGLEDCIYRCLAKRERESPPSVLEDWHLGLPNVDEQLSLRIVRTAIDRGINFMDNSWDYNNGISEIRMGKALRDGYRKRVFLMTKIDGRSKKAAAKQLDESLQRLDTDHIDLVQHHEILRFEDPHRIFDAEGANAALVEAQKAGKIRYIGFTGHKDPHIHLTCSKSRMITGSSSIQHRCR